MRSLKLVKILIIVAIIYNSWLLLTTQHIQQRFMKNVSYLNYQQELFNPLVRLIAPTISLISGWILFFVVAMQCSCIVTLITTSRVPYLMATFGLLFEGTLQVLMGEAGRAAQGVANPGWGLIVAGAGFFALREREVMIREQYALKK